MKYLVLICLAVVFAQYDGICQEGTDWKPALSSTAKGELAPEKGQISPDKAVQSARTFLKKVGLGSPNVKPEIMRTTFGKATKGSYCISFPGYAIVMVDVATGDVRTFSNIHRLNMRSNGSSAGSNPCINTRISAIAKLRNKIENLGASSQYVLRRLEFRDGNGSPVDIKRHPVSVFATFEPKPFGYPFRATIDCWTIKLDVMDGSVLDFCRAVVRPYKIESHAEKLSFEEAARYARPVVAKYKIGSVKSWERTDDKGRPIRHPAPPSFIGYVLPNDRFGGPAFKDNMTYRLAWILTYSGGDEVWIDAGNGKLLGGFDINAAMADRTKPLKSDTR